MGVGNCRAKRRCFKSAPSAIAATNDLTGVCIATSVVLAQAVKGKRAAIEWLVVVFLLLLEIGQSTDTRKAREQAGRVLYKLGSRF